jgi:hypothetical protein
MPEKPLSAFYAKGNHIQASAVIVLPISPTVLIVLNFMWVQSSA